MKVIAWAVHLGRIAVADLREHARVDTNIRTPMEIFNLLHHPVMPQFRRPYVWDETKQRAPLWADVRRMAELRMSDPFRACWTG